MRTNSLHSGGIFLPCEATILQREECCDCAELEWDCCRGLFISFPSRMARHFARVKCLDSGGAQTVAVQNGTDFGTRLPLHLVQFVERQSLSGGDYLRKLKDIFNIFEAKSTRRTCPQSNLLLPPNHRPSSARFCGK